MSEPETGGQESILVVDDTPENLRLLVDYLRQQGYALRLATNGPRALSAAEKDPPDLVLLDINMPGMDGYEVCRRLKACDATRDVPVIFVSAFDETMDKVKAFAVGGLDYVVKPFQFEEVGARVRTHLALRRSRALLQKSYEQLRRLEELRDGVTHMVVHDMTSPLTALELNMGLVRRSLGEEIGPQTERFLGQVERGIARLMRMIDDLLDANRLEAERMPLHLEDCDLAELVCTAAQEASALLPGAEVRVQTPGPFTLRCDPGLVRRVVENLVSNALKHNPPGGAVEVRLAEDEAGARITVRDRGEGIPPEYHEVIFAKFGTVEARKQRKYHSTGLGLAFCRLAVEAHDGRIGVEGRMGEGSTFWFTLPRR